MPARYIDRWPTAPLGKGSKGKEKANTKHSSTYNRTTKAEKSKRIMSPRGVFRNTRGVGTDDLPCSACRDLWPGSRLRLLVPFPRPDTSLDGRVRERNQHCWICLHLAFFVAQVRPWKCQSGC
jgi:hypothetical protein